jgi:Flp pilus assembly pilin Flp
MAGWSGDIHYKNRLNYQQKRNSRQWRSKNTPCGPFSTRCCENSPTSSLESLVFSVVFAFFRDWHAGCDWFGSAWKLKPRPWTPHRKSPMKNFNLIRNRFWQNFTADQRGVTTVEYALLLALIAGGLLFSLTALGNESGTFLGNSAGQLQQAIGH